MAKDYSGLNPRSAMGGGDLGLDENGLAVGKLWSPSQISQVENTIDQLRQYGEISMADINQSVNSLKEGIHHPTWQSAANKCIEAIFDFSPTNEGKANVISQLLDRDTNGQDCISLITELIKGDGDKDSIFDRLGSAGLDRLLGIARQSTPKSRSTGLMIWAKEGIIPKLDDGEKDEENQVDYTGQGGGPEMEGLKITLAAAGGNADEMASLIRESGMNAEELKQLSESIAEQYGQEIRPVLQELAINSKDASVRQFGFNGLMHLTADQGGMEQVMGPSGNADPSGNHNAQQNNELFDLSSLKSILNQPGIMINSLAARVGYSSETNAKLLQIILGD